MHVFQSPYLIQLKDGTVFLPRVRYVVPTGVARNMEESLLHQRPDATYTLSHFNSYERRYAGQQLHKGDSLLLYRHGAIGDTLMTTAVVKVIRDRNPDATIDLYCREQNAELWHGLGVNVLPGYPPFDAARTYTHHLLFENLLESNSEDDQGCAIDDLFSFAGIDPQSVMDEQKVPVVVEKEEDEKPRRHGFVGNKLVVIQWSASNPNRNYPHMLELVKLMCATFPYPTHVAVVGDLDGPRWGPEVQANDLRGETARFRNLIPIIKHAALVICPDSSVGHLAAAFPSVPVISLWGLFHPHDRVKYYTNHHPMTGFAACPHAPCRSHEFKLPAKCKDAPTSDGTSCAALASITPESIVAKAKELLCVS